MKYLFCVLCIITAFSINACKEINKVYYRRVKVLENNNTSYVVLSPQEDGVLRTYDSIWVDMTHHYLDDTSHFAMRCVIIP